MKIGQIIIQGIRRLALVVDNSIWVLGNGAPKTLLEVIQELSAGMLLEKSVNKLVEQFGIERVGSECDLLNGVIGGARVIRPIDPPEVWGCGVTYKRQAKEHDQDIETRTGKTEQLYSYVYENKRVEVFFKGLSRTTKGPFETIHLREDSRQVLPEAELVLVLGVDGNPVGYTLGNDLTAWDLERECPLYLNQAKIWNGSCSVGPFIIPFGPSTNLRELSFECNVIRNGETIIHSKGKTSEMKRSIEELCYYLGFNNPVSPGSLLFTGTACVIPHDFTLLEGDVVEVIENSIGMLINPVSGFNRES